MKIMFFENNNNNYHHKKSPTISNTTQYDHYYYWPSSSSSQLSNFIFLYNHYHRTKSILFHILAFVIIFILLALLIGHYKRLSRQAVLSDAYHKISIVEHNLEKIELENRKVEANIKTLRQKVNWLKSIMKVNNNNLNNNNNRNTSINEN